MAEVVGLTASIFQLITNTKNLVEIFADVKRSPEEHLQLNSEIQNLVPLLEDLENRLRQADPNDVWIENVRLLNRPGGSIEHFKGTLERLQKNLTPSSSKTDALRERLTWTFEKKQIREWIAQTERFKAYLVLAVQNDQLQLSRAIKDDTAKLPALDANVNLVIQDIEGLTITGKDQASKAQLREILDWISPLDFRHKQNGSFESHLEGSNQLFFNSDGFKDWCAGTQKCLFCDGEVGAGKTILVSQIVNLLKASHPDYPVLYAYCQYTEKPLHSPGNFIAAFLKQMIHFEDALPQEVESMYKRYGKQGTRPTVEEMLVVLKAKLSSYPKSFIIVDALDEYRAPQDPLLQKLASLQDTSNIFLTTRETVWGRWLHNMGCVGFKMPMGMRFFANTEDIQRYVRVQVPTLPRYLNQDAEMTQLITDRIVTSAAGRYLLAVLCINLLRDCTTKKEARVALKRLANQDSWRALDSLYEETLERIQAQDDGFRRLAERTINWLAWTEGFGRLDRVIELQHALAVESGSKELDTENIPEIDTILSACLGMVVVDAESGTIGFVHYSAGNCVRAYFIKDDAADHYDISDTCLTYLSLDAFRAGPCASNAEMDARLEQYPFLYYAATYWGEHAKRLVENMPSIALGNQRCLKLRSAVLDYLALDANRDAAAQVEYGRSFGYTDSAYYPKGLSALHVAASFGLRTVVEHLLTNGADSNAEDSYGCTPLNRAARRGHQYALSTLLENGADIHAQDHYGQDALHMAAWNGHFLALETLLDNAANPNALDHEGQTALHKAAAQGYQDIVTYLAQKGADLHIRDNSAQEPVDLALLNGHDALKWPMLHNWVAELDSDDYRRPPLHQAVRYGTDEEVAQILDEGHDINEVDWWDRPALFEAARCGLVSTAALLVARGADVSFEGPAYSSFPGPETACSLAADGYYVNYSRGLRKKDRISASQNKESALAIIQMLLQRHVAVYGLVEGLQKPLAMPGHPEQVSAVAEQDQDEELLLQLATTLVLEEGGFRDSKRPRASGARFE